MRAILLAWCSIALISSGARTVAGQRPAQTSSDSVRMITSDHLQALLNTYPPAQAMRFHRNPKDPFTILGSINAGLHYASSFDVIINITRQNTIGFRVYPRYEGIHINIDEAAVPSGLMRRMLRLSEQNFLFWATDNGFDVFAGYTITLESGFPEESIKEVILSLPLVDESVGELGNFVVQ